MLALALAILAASTVVALALRRRRGRPAAGLALRLDGGAPPPGVRHLASTVSDASDLGLRLPAARRALERKARLGVLLGLR